MLVSQNSVSSYDSKNAKSYINLILPIRSAYISECGPEGETSGVHYSHLQLVVLAFILWLISFVGHHEKNVKTHGCTAKRRTVVTACHLMFLLWMSNVFWLYSSLYIPYPFHSAFCCGSDICYNLDIMSLHPGEHIGHFPHIPKCMSVGKNNMNVAKGVQHFWGRELHFDCVQDWAFLNVTICF